MNTYNNTTSKTAVALPWYKVPILWLMISLLSFTVIGGINLFFLAHNSNDSIVTDKNYVPLDKKQANPSNSKNNKAKTH